MVRVRVLLFAGLRESVGAARLDLDLPEPVKVADAIAELERRHTNIKGQRFVAALNQRYVAIDASMGDGDELALIPPVSGG